MNIKKLSGLVVLLTLICFIGAKTVPHWKPIVFKEKGSKVLIKTDQKKVYYYKSAKDKDLVYEVIDSQRMLIKTVSRAKEKAVVCRITVDNKQMKYEPKLIKIDARYTYFDDITINLTPGKHTVTIQSYNKNAHFRAFQEVYKKIKEKKTIHSKVLVPKDYVKQYMVTKLSKTRNYYSVNFDQSSSITVPQDGNVTLYLRKIASNKSDCTVEIMVNGKLSTTAKISSRVTKQYKTASQEKLSIGKKVVLTSLHKNDKVTIVTKNHETVLYRAIYKKA